MANMNREQYVRNILTAHPASVTRAVNKLFDKIAELAVDIHSDLDEHLAFANPTPDQEGMAELQCQNDMILIERILIEKLNE